MFATHALQADIGTQAVNFPLEAPAWMRLAQPHDVIDLNFRKHSSDYITQQSPFLPSIRQMV